MPSQALPTVLAAQLGITLAPHCYYFPPTAYTISVECGASTGSETEYVFFTHWITQASIPNILQVLPNFGRHVFDTLGSAWPFGSLDPSVRQARYT